MKNIIVFTIILGLYSDMLIGQLNGSGTYQNPYYGVINTTLTWYPDDYPDDTVFARDIVISGTGHLTISPGLYYGGHVAFMSSHTLTINEGGSVTINPQTSVTVDNIINNGLLTLESEPNEPGVASLIHLNHSGNGTSVVRLYLSGGQTAGGNNKWHYISIPIDGIAVSLFNTLNLVQYVESLVTGSDNYPGWVAWDGYQYATGNTISDTFSELGLGRGYNYFSSASSTFALSGSPNISDQVVNVTCGAGYENFQGFNLIGNPFLSCLDWDDIILFHAPENINDAIYFTNNGQIASYVGGIGANGGSGTIPPMQGFFIKASANSTILLPASSRTHNLDQARYKKKSTENSSPGTDTISFIRLKMKSITDSSDVVIRFNNGATKSFDSEFDAYEFSKNSGDINLWTTIEGIDYSINGLPFPGSYTVIPIGIFVNNPGSLKLYSDELKNLDNFIVNLKDKITGQVYDFEQGGFIEFNAPSGLTESRFELTIRNSSSNVTDIRQMEDIFNVYVSHGNLIVQILNDDIQYLSGSITLYDISGRVVYKENNIDWILGEAFTIRNSFNPGLFLIEIRAGSYRLIREVVLF